MPKITTKARKPVKPVPAKSQNEGRCIVVAERGFVYVGEVTIRGAWVVVSEAKNIRYWGTTKGLGQLALEGPQSGTKLDACGSVKIPLSHLVTLMPCQTKNW